MCIRDRCSRWAKWHGISWWAWWFYTAASCYQIGNKRDQRQDSPRTEKDTKGERQDIAHKDEFVYFVHYAYAAQNVQQKVPRTFRGGMELADAKLWRAATRKEMDRLEELRVFTLAPSKTVPTGARIYKPQWVFKIKADNSHKALLVAVSYTHLTLPTIYSV